MTIGLTRKNTVMLMLCDDTKEYLILVVTRLRSAVSPAWYFSYFVFFFSCWCCSRRFLCSVDFSYADLVDAPLEESVGITGGVPGYVSATHVLLLLTLLQSSSAGTVTRRPSASTFVGMLMAHCWRYFLNLMICNGVGSVLTAFIWMSSGWVKK